MTYRNTSASLTEQDIQEIKAALHLLQEKLPFLIHLTADERRKMVKMGDKSHAFVTNSLTAAQTNQEILPSNFDLEAYLQNHQLSIALGEIHISLKQLVEKVDDTLVAVRSDVMLSSLTVYEYVKTAAKRTPGLKSIAEQLSLRFRAMRSRTAKAANLSNQSVKHSA